MAFSRGRVRGKDLLFGKVVLVGVLIRRYPVLPNLVVHYDFDGQFTFTKR